MPALPKDLFFLRGRKIGGHGKSVKSFPKQSPILIPHRKNIPLDKDEIPVTHEHATRNFGRKNIPLGKNEIPATHEHATRNFGKKYSLSLSGLFCQESIQPSNTFFVSPYLPPSQKKHTSRQRRNPCNAGTRNSALWQKKYTSR